MCYVFLAYTLAVLACFIDLMIETFAGFWREMGSAMRYDPVSVVANVAAITGVCIVMSLGLPIIYVGSFIERKFRL